MATNLFEPWWLHGVLQVAIFQPLRQLPNTKAWKLDVAMGEIMFGLVTVTEDK